MFIKAFIIYLIKRYLPDHHLAKNPVKKEKKRASDVYPTCEE